MDARALISRQLAVSYDRVMRCVDGLTEEEVRQVLAGQLNPVVWQLGHRASVDSTSALRSGGAPTAPPHYADLFRPGPGGVQDYPPLEEVRAAFDGAQEELLRLAARADLSSPLDSPAYTTVGEMLVSACVHRGSHMGKMATLRALLGKPLPR